MMIRALKMTADRTALRGLASPMTLSTPSAGVERNEHRRHDREVLRHVVGDREGRQRAARHQELLADPHHLDQLGRVAVEVDHVAGLPRGLGTGVHGHADVGLRQRRRVVRAVAAHGDQPSRGLFTCGSARASSPGWPRRGSRRPRPRRRSPRRSSGLSPVIITVRMPMRRSCGEALARCPRLTMSLSWTTPRTRAVLGDQRAASRPRARSARWIA